MLIGRVVTVKSRVTPNLRSQLASETQKAMREVDSEVAKAATEKERAELSIRKDDLVRQLKDIARLEDGAEITRGQVQGFWHLKVGDVWPLVLSAEIVVEDGIVVAVREGRTISVSLDRSEDGGRGASK